MGVVCELAEDESGCPMGADTNFKLRLGLKAGLAVTQGCTLWFLKQNLFGR